MTWALIALVVVMALAPLWHFKPTKRQRRQASLREAAALSGLFVEFRDLPLPPARLARLAAVDRQVIYYGRRLRASRGEGRATISWWRVDDAWESLPRRQALPSALIDLPPQILAVSVSESSCGCYWREDGEADTVADIARILSDWALEMEDSS